jgi:hypothetical protein
MKNYRLMGSGRVFEAWEEEKKQRAQEGEEM